MRIFQIDIFVPKSVISTDRITRCVIFRNFKLFHALQCHHILVNQTYNFTFISNPISEKSAKLVSYKAIFPMVSPKTMFQPFSTYMNRERKYFDIHESRAKSFRSYFSSYFDVQVDGKHVDLNFWDTSGSYNFKLTHKVLYSHTVYGIVTEAWIKNMCNYCRMCLSFASPWILPPRMRMFWLRYTNFQNYRIHCKLCRINKISSGSTSSKSTVPTHLVF